MQWMRCRLLVFGGRTGLGIEGSRSCEVQKSAVEAARLLQASLFLLFGRRLCFLLTAFNLALGPGTLWTEGVIGGYKK